jgi:uncharacterized membrane protein (UPF0127 family)
MSTRRSRIPQHFRRWSFDFRLCVEPEIDPVSDWCRRRLLPIVLLGVCAGCDRSVEPVPAPTGADYVVTVGGHRIRVVVAITPAQQQRGLMHRTKLDEDAGMLFVYDTERTLSFWMRDTLIPLSIAFIDGDLVVRDIQDMASLDDKTHHVSKVPAMYALEVNRGWFERHDVGVGAQVTFSPDLNDLLGL